MQLTINNWHLTFYNLHDGPAFHTYLTRVIFLPITFLIINVKYLQSFKNRGHPGITEAIDCDFA